MEQRNGATAHGWLIRRRQHRRLCDGQRAFWPVRALVRTGHSELKLRSAGCGVAGDRRCRWWRVIF